MSTPVNALSASDEPDCNFGWQHLAERLLSLADAPTLAEVNQWVAEAHITAEDICHYRRFREGAYARNRVLKTEVLEALILCWEPGQCTVIHDHNGSFGVVRVLEGELSETLFGQDSEGILRRTREAKWQPGAVTGADVPDIHCLYNCNQSGQKLVTLHIYCPPLHKLNTYKENSAEVTQIISGETPQSCQDA
jgi:cysteine dioxygenase